MSSTVAISIKTSNVVLFISLAATLLSLGVSGGGNATVVTKFVIFGKWRVHVVNGFGGSKPLFVHCKSKDDDLGTHLLATGAEFNWSFRTSISRRTLFWCYLRTDNNVDPKIHAAFDVFWTENEHDWLARHCNVRNCIWIARDDGVYLRDNRIGQDDFVHKWEPGW